MEKRTLWHWYVIVGILILLMIIISLPYIYTSPIRIDYKHNNIYSNNDPGSIILKAIDEKNVSICENLKPYMYTGLDSEKDGDLCELTFGYYYHEDGKDVCEGNNWCIIGLAKAEKNITYCEETDFKPTRNKDSCFIEIAKATSDYSICNYLESDFCYTTPHLKSKFYYSQMLRVWRDTKEKINNI